MKTKEMRNCYKLRKNENTIQINGMCEILDWIMGLEK